MKKLLIAIALTSLAGTGCTDAAATDMIALTKQSCYDTGFGLKCVPTPDGIVLVATDVNGDGVEDEFVCGDAASASDSDSTEDDSDSESVDDDNDENEVDEDEDGDADSESDSDSDSDSDEDCGPSIEEDGESSESNSDEDGDGDGDTIADVNDCDCI